ncbi:hypothetical protein [Anaeromyxobacter oryzisoli]|uniref:hypothetical protein n=1 Tax=Anaeromyxobacter oryzisoli TaxID=2925408 RepID=UPI001F5B0140|nr:hypothetical protein [Anaeromyxobacter sp. SG63]
MKLEEWVREEEWDVAWALGFVSTSLVNIPEVPDRTAAPRPTTPSRDVAALLDGSDPLPPLAAEDFVFPV